MLYEDDARVAGKHQSDQLNLDRQVGQVYQWLYLLLVLQ